MTKVTPFRMIGNVYFVGTVEASSHLIDTGDGLILIDTGYEENAETVVESMNALGFDIKDVKIILHSHGHYDHTGATAKILTLVPSAKTFLSFHDIRYIEGFQPDFDIQDGDVIALGNTKIECWFTPGHTEGSVSFFLDVVEDGQVYKAGMFGGSGTNQLRKGFLKQCGCSLLNRGLYFQSIERLKKEHVDIFLGNHCWNNKTKEKYEQMQLGGPNPFIDDSVWVPYLECCERNALKVLQEESRSLFINYAHRGACAYMPENTLSAFYLGIYQGANGIETDVRMTKDGVLVLFHDPTLERMAGEGIEGGVCDYTWEELQTFTLTKKGMTDKIAKLEDFLRLFSFRDITFAIEIKQPGIEPQIADMLRKYNMVEKTVVTSFKFGCIRAIKEYAPEFHVGFLTKVVTDEIIADLKAIGGEEICPKADIITPESVVAWHREGLNVRAWGISNREVMEAVYDAGADGMTVNFPDKLTAYIQQQTETGEQ